MPIAPPNFVFTDPVAAQNLYQLSQLAQLDEAARRQSMLGTLQAVGQQRIARENSAAERARLQSQSDLAREQMRAQAQENSLNRLARTSDLDRTIVANKDLAKIDAEARAGQLNTARKEAVDIEGYNFLLNQVQGDDPPTDEEFAEASKTLAPDRSKRLDAVRRQNIAALTQAADNAEAMANYWNARMDQRAAPGGITRTPEEIVAEATKSQAGKFIIFDPGMGRFRPAVKRPRISATGIPPRSGPGVVNYDRGGGVQTIEELMRRMQPSAPAAPPAGTPSPPWNGAPVFIPPSFDEWGNFPPQFRGPTAPLIR